MSLINRPLVRGLARPLTSALAGYGSPFSIMGLGPSFATSYDIGWLNTLGERAGYLETVASLVNAGSGADGVQATANLQPVCLAHTGENYLHCPGVTGNGASVPDAAALDITGNISIEVETRFNIPQADDADFITKAQTSGQISWGFSMSSTGNPYFYFSPDGAFGSVVVVSAIGSITPTTGDLTKLRVIRSGGNYSFYLSLNGSAFAQIGSTVSGSSSAMFSSTSAIEIGGGTFGANPLRGSIHRAKVWNTATPDVSSPVLDIDFSTFSDRATTGTAATGQTVTINQAGDNPATLVGRPLLRFDGVDDTFSIAGAYLGGPTTFVSLFRLGDKNQLLWSDGGNNRHLTIQDGNAFEPDASPAGSAVYRKNGTLLGALSRDGVHDNYVGPRMLEVATFTYDTGIAPLILSGNGPSVNIIQGDIEELYIFPRILTAAEIAKIETAKSP